MKIEAKRRAAKWQPDASRSDARDLVALAGRSLPRNASVVLAVSGGLDSMCLLDAAAAAQQRRGCTIVVATFDHASGSHSTRAAEFVARAAARYGCAVVIGRTPGVEESESAWREARWQFLRTISERVGGPVVTAHNRDDQIETVLMRALRGAGARGLAGLRARSAVRRPFLDVSRAQLRAYADERAVHWIDDPTNQSVKYLRNRVRRQILPAILEARPELAGELLELANRAAAWRDELATLVDTTIEHGVRCGSTGTRSLVVRIDDLKGLSASVLNVVWPELASRLNVTLDRRGTLRATALTLAGETGGRIQLSGGWELGRSRDRMELYAAVPATAEALGACTLTTPMSWGSWRFAEAEESREGEGQGDRWRASLPRGVELRVRRWQPGDRLCVRHGDRLTMRKVKYFLTDARISGHIRASWPVVVAGDEIVWIPGVRRSDAAAARSGGPVVTYVCDYLDHRS
jgi:tRNA(Ile)-lysidine synthetase-like protein